MNEPKQSTIHSIFVVSAFPDFTNAVEGLHFALGVLEHKLFECPDLHCRSIDPETVDDVEVAHVGQGFWSPQAVVEQIWT